MKLEFTEEIFQKNSGIFVKIRPVGAELFHVVRQTDAETEMTRMIVASCNVANTPNKGWMAAGKVSTLRIY